MASADGSPLSRDDVSARIQQALRSVALGVSAVSGSDVFASIVRHTTESLGVDFALISRLSDPVTRTATTLAICYRGEILPNITYELEHTPCNHVVDRSFYLIEDGAQAIYPGEETLEVFNLHSYAGYPLFAADGRALGLIAVACSQPLRERELIENLLQIFSVRAAAEMERMAAEGSYRAIFEASEDAVFVHDIDSGAIVDVNPKACQVYGYSYEEMMQVSVDVLGTGSPPYAAEDARRWLDRARSEPQRFEWLRRNKNGSLHWDEVSLQRATIDGIDRIVAITRDITERKQAEEERAQLELQLRQAQRMEAIGHLAGGIAHDFNNILTGLLGYAVMAQERAEQLNDEPLQRYLGHALRSAEKARDLIQQMLTFSRGSRGEPRLIAPAEVLGNFFPLLDSTLPATIEIEHQFARELPPVLIDPVQLEQVLMNLSINARDAMNSHGELRLALQPQSFKAAVCSSCLSRISGDYVVLSVSDSGPGIEPGVHARMFEPFFTTKTSGKSSGMGLAMVHGIVHECGGHVLVESQPGVGTTFRVLLPPSMTAECSAPASKPTNSHHRQPLRGRVAIVDDEREVISFMADRLSGWGLEVEPFCDSVIAFDAISADIDTWDLVILDQTMPRLTGIELARQLTVMRPALPVLLYSGYGDELSEAQLQLAGVQVLLKKPVDQEQLYRTLAAMLEASPAG